MTLLEVGRIGKAHGLRGEVVVRLVTDRLERLAPGSILQTNRGDFTVVSSRPHQDRWLVMFEGVNGRTEAEALHGVVLMAEPIEDPAALFVHDLVGAMVIDQGGVERGVVQSVLANPASDLLVLDDERLVPLNFVVGDLEVDDAGRRIVRVEVPDGLFDL